MLNELTSIYNRPPTGYHFSVIFNYDFKVTTFLPLPHDSLFQEVSGLSCQSSGEIDLKEGGSEVTHKRPSLNYAYTDLVLRRGLCAKSLVTQWVKESINAAQLTPLNIYIALLNDVYFPVHSWFVEEAYPVGWKFSSLDATKGEVMTETITLKYSRFTTTELIAEGHAAALATSLIVN